MGGNDGNVCYFRDRHCLSHAPTAERVWEMAATQTTGGRGMGAGSQHNVTSQHL